MAVEDNIIIGDEPNQDFTAWAMEEPVENIIAPEIEDQFGDDANLVNNEVLRAEAMVMITNIAENQPKEVLSDLTTKVIEGYKTDLANRS